MIDNKNEIKTVDYILVGLYALFWLVVGAVVGYIYF